MSALPRAKVQAYVLVRDASGHPKIDGDPRALPESIKTALTKEEFSQAVREFEGRRYGNT